MIFKVWNIVINEYLEIKSLIEVNIFVHSSSP